MPVGPPWAVSLLWNGHQSLQGKGYWTCPSPGFVLLLTSTPNAPARSIERGTGKTSGATPLPPANRPHWLVFPQDACSFKIHPLTSCHLSSRTRRCSFSVEHRESCLTLVENFTGGRLPVFVIIFLISKNPLARPLLVYKLV